jgi:hypothetical protein
MICRKEKKFLLMVFTGGYKANEEKMCKSFQKANEGTTQSQETSVCKILQNQMP